MLLEAGLDVEVVEAVLVILVQLRKLPKNLIQKWRTISTMVVQLQRRQALLLMELLSLLPTEMSWRTRFL
jgi:hypothetical protein